MPYDISSGVNLGSQPLPIRQTPEQKAALARAAMQYVNVDPNDPSKGRIGVRGAGRRLTPEEEAHVRKNFGQDEWKAAPQYGEGSRMRVPKTSPGSSIKYKDASGNMVDFAGAQKPIESVDFETVGSSITKQNEQQAYARAQQEKDADLARQLKLQQADPEYQQKMMDLATAKEDRERAKIEREFTRETERENRRATYQREIHERGRKYDRDQAVLSRQIGRDEAGSLTNQDQETKQLMDEGMDPSDAQAAAAKQGRQKLEARRAAARDYAIQLMGTNPALAKALLMKSDPDSSDVVSSMPDMDPTTARQTIASERSALLSDLESGQVDSDTLKERVQSIMHAAQAGQLSPEEIQGLKTELRAKLQRLMHPTTMQTIGTLLTPWSIPERMHKSEQASEALGFLPSSRGG